MLPYKSKMHNLHLCITEGTLLVHSLLYWNFRTSKTLPTSTRTTISFVIIGTVVLLAFTNLALVFAVAFNKCKQWRARSAARVEAVDNIVRGPSDVIMSFEGVEKQATEEIKNEKWVESADSQSHPTKPAAIHTQEQLTESTLLAATGRTQITLKEERKKDRSPEKIWKHIMES